MHCPNCSSHNITIEVDIPEDPISPAFCECSECGHAWETIYEAGSGTWETTVQSWASF